MRDAHADHLQPSEQVRKVKDLPDFREVVEATAILGPVPPPARESTDASRRAFLNEAARIRAYQAVHPATLRLQILHIVAPVAAALIVVLSLLGSAIAAAQGAAPDSPLYPGKLAWEDVRLTLALNPLTRAELALTFAEARMTEIEGMAAADQPIPAAVHLRMEAQLQQALRYAAQLAEAPMNHFLARMEGRVRQRVQVMCQAMDGAPEQRRAALQGMVRVLERAQEIACLGQEDPEGFREWGNREAGSSWGNEPAPSTPVGTCTVQPDPTAPPATGQGNGPHHFQSPGPDRSPSGPAGPTPQPTLSSSPTPSLPPGRPDDTPGRPDDTPGRPDDTPGRPDDTPGRPDGDSRQKRPSQPQH